MKQLLASLVATLVVAINASVAIADQTFTVLSTASPDPSASCGTGPVDTGIYLANHQSAVVTGSGSATWDVENGSLNGPAGDLSASPGPYGASTGGYIGGLIGEVGTSGWRSIGTGPTTLAGPGELLLAFDDITNVCDNTGSFNADVSIVNSPPESPPGGGDCHADQLQSFKGDAGTNSAEATADFFSVSVKSGQEFISRSCGKS